MSAESINTTILQAAAATMFCVSTAFQLHLTCFLFDGHCVAGPGKYFIILQV